MFNDGRRVISTKSDSCRSAAQTRLDKFAAVSNIEGGWEGFQCGSRFSAAHIRLMSLQQFQGWKAVPSQHVALV
eukprot:1806563-Pyramimonas_sp.AAC.2